MAQPEELLERARVLIRDLREKLAAAEKRRPEPVAVVGMACRFPGSAENVDAFLRMILAGDDAITAVPRNRWHPEEVGDSVHRQGAFLRNVTDFDAAFFDIVPREAVHMDPQQRLFLEVAWHALEHAGLTRAMLAGSETGVFVGVHNHSSDYYSLEVADLPNMDAHSVTGTSHDVIAGRLAYLLDLRGPSLVINTACSSSLVAVHLACRSIMAGDCRTAVVGGVNLLLEPTTTIMGSKLNLLAPDGRCKPFDARANGFGRGEGCGVVVLKRLSDAVAQRDQILGVIRGSAINQDGRTNGLTAPNGLSQAAVIRRALEEAGVAPGQIGYVETHGTGTALGDPIEVEALAEALPGTMPPCALGAVKGNIGHLEGAAGIAGLIKTLLVLRHRTIPPVAQLGELNPHLSLAGTRLEAPTVARPWNVDEGRLRVAGVSSFGWSGTNAHVIVAEAPELEAIPTPATELIVPVSAATPAALQQLAGAYADAAERLTPEQLVHFAYTAGARRTHYAFRRAAVGRDGADIARQLRGHSTVEHPLRTRYEEAGERLDWDHLYPANARVVDLPAYPFQRQRFWLNRDRQTQAREAPDNWFYDIAWQPALPSLKVPGLRADLEREAQEYARQALAQLGDTPSIAPEQLALYRRLSAMRLAPAAEANLATPVATSAEQALLRKCGPKLAGVLQGRVNPLDLLFGGSWTAERLYKESLAMQAGYAAVRRAFDELAAAKPLRVLEIGAGTGATTAVLLAHQRHAIAEYVVTDLSPTLLQHTRDQFSQYPFVRFMPLDIEQPATGQGFSEGAYDVVIAANVLHATADIQASLAEIRCLLAPGGALLLLETTAERLWVDLVFGLTEGWWRFRDHALRPKSALLDAATWARTLAEAGFATVAEAETGIPADASVGQSVFVAHQPGAAALRAPWVVLADRNETLTAHLPAGTAVVVREGETWEPVAASGVLCCWALDDDVEAEQLTWRVVELLQAMTRAKQPAAKLWLLTRGAVQTAAGIPVAIEQAPLWGLGATLAVEHPEHWGGLVDLDPLREARDQAAEVWRVITGSAGEDRMALRDGTVLVPRLAPGAAPPRGVLPALRADACYLVTGAFGGVGAPLCDWLVAQGARHLLLAGRHTIQQETVRRLEEQGVQVTAALCDVADPAAVAQLLAQATQPVRGIFHAAAEPASQPLHSMTRDQVTAAFRPKVQGTRVLLEQTRECPLDFVVLFSSSAAVFGARGRGHYGAANAFLEAVAVGRQATCSIAWGAWEVLRSDTAAELEAVLQSGLTPMPAAQALNAMGRVMMATAGRPYQLVASADWERLKSALAVRGQDRLLSGIGAGSVPAAEAAPAPAQVSSPRRRPMIEIVAGAVREVFGLAPDAPLEYDRGFFDLGMDSLMSVDLKARLEAELGRELPGTLTLNYPTVLALTAYLQGGREATTTPARVPAAVSAEAAAVAGLSNEEVRDALAAELALLRKGS